MLQPNIERHCRTTVVQSYDRGHMAPNADMPNKAAQFDSFSLANMVPQAPKNNQQVWRELEEATRALVTKQKLDVFVVTGPVFQGKKLKTIGQGVIVPSAVYKAVYMPKNRCNRRLLRTE